jgi:hypothetical protein
MTATKSLGLLVLAGAIVSVFPAPLLGADGPPSNPTFTKDIAPIFQEKCEACHRADSIAPMSLVTFEEARPWARSIKERVASRQMPPWHIDKTVGIQDFKNDRSLSDDQLATIVKWVDTGAPKGDAKDMPPAKEWPDESVWNFAKLFGGPPDLVIKSTPWTQKAQANDAWWKPVVETGLTEARWVRAIEIRPATVKGRKITHHAIARLQQEEDTPGQPDSGPAPADSGVFANTGTFMEWAVGKQGEIMRPNSGKLMLPGSRIVWDIHYSSAGEDITDHVELGIYLYPKGQEPKYRQVLHLMGSGGVDIPPNSVKATQGFFALREAARVESFQPHMHLRGKAMAIDAILPTGQVQTLSHVADFNFNWHNSYVYSDDAAPLLPKGTIMRITAWHDNTTAKKSNPEPNTWVGYGDRTVDEMAHAWVNVTYFSEEDYQAELAARKARTASRTTEQRQQQ